MASAGISWLKALTFFYKAIECEWLFQD